MNKNEYVKTIWVNGYSVDIGLDDYGQSYFIEYEENGERQERGLGTYNSEYMEAIYNILDPKYKYLCGQFYTGKITDEEAREYEEYLDMFDREYSIKK